MFEKQKPAASAGNCLGMMAMALSLAACAPKSETDYLQSQIDGLRVELASVHATASEALSALQEAEVQIAALKSHVGAFETLCKPKK